MKEKCAETMLYRIFSPTTKYTAPKLQKTMANNICSRTLDLQDARPPSGYNRDRPHGQSASSSAHLLPLPDICRDIRRAWGVSPHEGHLPSRQKNARGCDAATKGSEEPATTTERPYPTLQSRGTPCRGTPTLPQGDLPSKGGREGGGAKAAPGGCSLEPPPALS